MKILQKLKSNYIKSLPLAICSTTGISAYYSIKHEIARPCMLPYIHRIKNVAISSVIGFSAGLFYPITFPLYLCVFICNSLDKK